MSRDLDAALRTASAHRTGEVMRQFVYLCFHYDPIRREISFGDYGGNSRRRDWTLAGLAGVIWQAQRRRAREAVV